MAEKQGTPNELDKIFMKSRLSRRNTIIAGGVAIGVVALGGGAYMLTAPGSTADAPTPEERPSAPRPSAPTSPTAPAPTPVAPEAPFTPGTKKLVIAINRNIRTWNPLLSERGGVIGAALLMMFESLTYNGPEKVRFPLLATSTEPVDGFKITRIKLREGVKFHDGTDFNADAVKNTIDIYNTEKKSRHPYFLKVSEVVVNDDHNMDVVWAKNNIANYNNILHRSMPLMMSPKAYADDGFDGLTSNPVGTGRFKMKSFEPGVKTTMEIFKDYWGFKVPAADRAKNPTLQFGNVGEATLVTIREPTAALTALKSGEVDVIVRFSDTMLNSIKNDPAFDIADTGPFNITSIHFNTLYKPLTDKRVRQALNYAADKEGVVRIFRGNVTLATGPMAPWHVSFDPNHKNYPFDPEKAKTLLAEAGFKDGLDLAMGTPSSPMLNPTLEAFQSNYRSVGIDATFKIFDRQSWSRIRRNPDQTEIHTPPITIGFDNDIEFFDFFFTRERQGMQAGIKYPVIDDLIDPIRTSTDEAAHKKAYIAGAKYVFDEALQIWAFWGASRTVSMANRVDVDMFKGEGTWQPHLWKVLT